MDGHELRDRILIWVVAVAVIITIAVYAHALYLEP